MQIKDVEAQKIIANNIHMVLATSSLDGSPWISPVFFAFDQNYNLFWFSSKEAHHSKLIQKNPQVAITIFNTDPSKEKGAVYLEATAKELIDEWEIEHVISILDKRIKDDKWRVKTPKEVTGSSLKRVFQATIQRAYKRVESEKINGQYFSKRIEIQ